MTEGFHRPTKLPPSMLEAIQGGLDPAEETRIAHETAVALLARVRENPDPAVVDRLVNYTDEHGIDAIAELWSHASPRSLPGAMWRIYLLRLLIRQDPVGTSYSFQRGTELIPTVDPVIAGAADPTGPAEITVLADQILRGLYIGDFAIALERAASFCRINAVGCSALADDRDVIDPAEAAKLTTKAARFSTIAGELAGCAKLWRSESLD
ncbi:MAG TPA: DNA-directed RNA polymerase subunit beta [Plantibacter sp.]|uniref:DNA-directed RNA polymerase subunit beta n=1 Tax=unclassified Plantibacter TaxID=2624265 RepID=UPI002C608875|nr:DNA-directed RNA polymerase subunit beta [Plantibacter sp.]